MPKSIDKYDTGDEFIVYFRKTEVGSILVNMYHISSKYKRVEGQRLVKLNVTQIADFLTEKNRGINPKLYNYLKECVSSMTDVSEW